jgi:oxepin-CoA hydrolase/3-oxo-5,6-dehydrosuberyl-CoA semialdehyde dehydrogenase
MARRCRCSSTAARAVQAAAKSRVACVPLTHFLQRAAVQGSPTMLAAVTREYVRGANVQEEALHPFRNWFDDLAIGDSLLTHRRTVTDADILAFGGISGDFFYRHFDEVAARQSAFGRRIAHGYFVLSAAAGLFVSPAEGPVLANYGLDTLRVVKPVGIGDTIQARLTCKRKIDKPARKDQPAQGVVAWDVQVTNQDGELVASYDILTLVLNARPQPAWPRATACATGASTLAFSALP